jgi:apolipoprotein N-acyltransferase
MFEPDKIEKPLPSLLYGLFLIGFGILSLFIVWFLSNVIDNWFLLGIMVISFGIPAFGAFVLGLRRLIDLASDRKASGNRKEDS